MVGLFQFLLRLSCGLAAAMAVTSPRWVTSGYYRNNLYVLLGLNVFATLIAWRGADELAGGFWPALVASLLCYVGSVLWLYEQPRPGISVLTLIAALSALGLLLHITWWSGESWLIPTLKLLDPLASAALLGSTTAAMLLGHWYLNAPGMKLEPLFRLIALMAGAIVVRSVICGLGWMLLREHDIALNVTHTALLALRWLAGLVGPAIVAWMSWQTLRIPNTQSTTGILYVGVIGVFLGETIATLLASELGWTL